VEEEEYEVDPENFDRWTDPKGPDNQHYNRGLPLHDSCAVCHIFSYGIRLAYDIRFALHSCTVTISHTLCV
jgi:hypothetical protein